MNIVACCENYSCHDLSYSQLPSPNFYAFCKAIIRNNVDFISLHCFQRLLRDTWDRKQHTRQSQYTWWKLGVAGGSGELEMYKSLNNCLFFWKMARDLSKENVMDENETSYHWHLYHPYWATQPDLPRAVLLVLGLFGLGALVLSMLGFLTFLAIFKR